ncbi:D,D-heptose 1,7-bisphosphate phosphatase [Candidatus Promineifilum breve]|uniref:D,D-heptose 1,7-bisphosphate phosphatase n=1 Tax=Candidatus Promineifilum breve TaxID=1806508 RepID=A0A160T0T0_9CHLR|nr:HAD-IIIA family hydrolase [Candidatus Promineifilum breve]CUS03396.2 D,D-heptose 1,7-bisphosphate phosphatase [Candidatus Promineifilum breve]
MKHPALFLDRDGVIIENCSNYVRSWADVAIFPQAVAALAAVRDCPYRIVLVTNQSAVGRGLISQATAEAINDRLLAHVRAAGGRIDAVYMCPHGPDDGCDCRKPLPGLLLRAAEELDIDLSRSVMIGDALSDVMAGQAAGARAVLLRTGRGGDQERLPGAADLPPFLVYDTLADALPAVIESP